MWTFSRSGPSAPSLPPSAFLVHSARLKLRALGVLHHNHGVLLDLPALMSLSCGIKCMGSSSSAWCECSRVM